MLVLFSDDGSSVLVNINAKTAFYYNNPYGILNLCNINSTTVFSKNFEM